MVIPSGFGQATLVWSGSAVPLGAVSTHGFEHSGGGDPSTVAGVIASVWDTTWMANVSSAINLDRVEVKFGPDATGPSGDATSGTAGGGTGLAVTPQVAWLVRKNTGLGGRKGRGRMYLPGLEEGNVNSGGNIDATVLSNAQTDLDTILSGLATLNLPMHLLHGDATPPTEVTSLVAQAQVGTQRRRNRR